MTSPQRRHFPLRTAAHAACTALALAALVLPGCTSATYPTYDASAGAIDAQQVDALARGADLSEVRSVSTTDAPGLRQEALTRLRAQGEDAARAATMLTKGFPVRTAAVPVIVRRATVDGTDTLVVVEAWGAPGGRLDHTRLWLFDWNTGRVLRSDSYR